MQREVIVREAKPKELEKIGRLLATAFKTSNTYMNFLILTVPKPKEEGKGRYIVGAVGIVDNNRICQLVISKAYRRKGLGAILLGKVIKKVGTSAYLRVKMWNWKAIRMYWKAGFEIVGIRKQSFIMALKAREMPMFERSEMVMEEGKITRLLYPINYWEYRKFKDRVRYSDKYKAFIGQASISSILAGGGRIKYATPKEEISWRTMAEAFNYNVEWRGNDRDLYNLLAYNKIPKGDWNELITADGAWIKRFSKACSKLGVPPSEQAKRFIGDYVASLLSGEFELEIVKQFNFKDSGKFGDPNSCWYSSQRRHPDCLFREGGPGWIFKVYVNGRGVSRAWLYYDRVEDVVIMFNGRGRVKDRLPAMISAYLGVPHAQVNTYIANNQHDHYTDCDYEYAFGHNLKKNYAMRWCDD